MTEIVCPEPLVALATDVYHTARQKLIINGCLDPIAHLLRFDADAGAIRELGVIQMALSDQPQQRDAVAGLLRLAVIQSGANATIHVSDVWVSAADDIDVPSRHHPRLQEALLVLVELNLVGKWMFVQTYSRVEGSVRIQQGPPPPLEYAEGKGRFTGLFEALG